MRVSRELRLDNAAPFRQHLPDLRIDRHRSSVISYWIQQETFAPTDNILFENIIYIYILSFLSLINVRMIKNDTLMVFYIILLRTKKYSATAYLQSYPARSSQSPLRNLSARKRSTNQIHRFANHTCSRLRPGANNAFATAHPVRIHGRDRGPPISDFPGNFRDETSGHRMGRGEDRQVKRDSGNSRSQHPTRPEEQRGTLGLVKSLPLSFFLSVPEERR